MAFGFTPKYEQDLDLNNFDPKYYLAISLDAAKQLEWRISYKSKSGFIAFIGGGFFASMEEFHVRIEDDKVFIISKNAGNGMYDWGKNKKHVEAFIETFDNIHAKMSDQQLVEKVAELAPIFESTEKDKLCGPPHAFKDNIKSFTSLFIPRSGYFITPIIINVNILVFALMVFSGVSIIEPTSVNLIGWGANLRSLVLGGEWWRLVTNIFLHIGILHLLLNMYALLYIGIILEPYLGKIRFAAAYFFTGVLASLTSIYWHPTTISAGASGAIFGMYGVFLAMLTTNFIDKSMRKQLLASIGVFVFYNLMNGMKAQVDNAAHIGGLLSGLVIGYVYCPSLNRPLSLKIKYLTVCLLAAMVLLTSFVIYKKIPDDTVRYDADMKEFANKEQAALSVFKMPRNAPESQLLEGLNKNGIKNWEESLRIIETMDKLDLPVEFAVRNNKLRQYCKLRIKSYEYISKDIENNTNQYKSSIDSCNAQIQTIINDLKGSN